MKKKKKEKPIQFERIMSIERLLCQYCNYPFIIVNRLECPNCLCSVNQVIHGLKAKYVTR